MMIRVMYSDGRFDMVKPSLLETLLKEETISSFKRSSGWAVVGRDPIRSDNKADYSGTERHVT